MSTLQFPKNPSINDEYDWEGFKYVYDGQKWKTIGVGYNPVNDLRNEVLPTAREAIKRSYAEAGFNLVSGSFELGGVVTTATDVLLYEADGHAYSWSGSFPSGGKNVPQGSTPSTSGGALWSDQYTTFLRHQMASPYGASLTGTKFDYGSLEAHISRDSSTSEYGRLTSQVKKRLAKRSAKVVLVGDSLSSFYNIDSVNFSSLFESHLRRRIMEINPSIHFYNRAIGGKRYYDLGRNEPAITSFTSGYPWYDNISKRWMSYIDDIKPDVIFLAFGMNDGAGWDVGNFQQENFLSMMEDLRSISSHPEIVFCTNILPSNENPSSSDAASQHGRDAMAGWTRSYAKRLGYSYIDLHRRFKMLRDGFDPNVMHYARKTIQKEVVLPWDYTDLPCDGYSARLTIDDPLVATSGIQFQLSSYANNFLSLRYNGSLWETTVYTASNNTVGTSIRSLSSGEAPEVGTKINFVLNGSTVTIFVGDNTEPVFNEQVIRFGGSFTPRIGGSGQVRVDLMVGTMLPCQASLTDSDIYSAGSIDGGNGLNHPAAKASSIIYGRPLDYVFNSDGAYQSTFDVTVDFVGGKIVVDSLKNPDLCGSFKLLDMLTFISGSLQFSRDVNGNVIGAIFGATNRGYIDGTKFFNLVGGCSAVDLEVDYYVPSSQAYTVTLGENITSDRLLMQATDDLRHRGTLVSGGVSSDLISSSSFPFVADKFITSCYRLDCDTSITTLSEPDGFRRGNINTHKVTSLSLDLFSKLKFGYASPSTYGSDVVISSVKLRIM